MNFNVPRERRRFYLERGFRKQPVGAGSSLRRLMEFKREVLHVNPTELFGDIEAVIVGGVATRAYAPERHTKDIDFLVEHARYDEAQRRLASEGWMKNEELFFPNTSLGLRGSAWERNNASIDVMSTGQEWGREALALEAFDQAGLRVIALPYLVLMKLESARGIDQGDLTRMLGRLNEQEIEHITKVVERHSRDPQSAEDVRQYALLGQLEWEQGPHDQPHDPT